MSASAAVAVERRRTVPLRAMAPPAGVALGTALPGRAVPAIALALALAIGLRSWHKP